MLKGKTVVLGVTGSIAAYKIANLASMLSKLHADIHVLMTENATNFINPITFETLTGHKCLIDTFDRNFQYSVEHVSLAKKADVVLVAPASANVIGKIANGIADTSVTMAVKAHLRNQKPVLLAVSTNDGLGTAAKNIGTLLNCKNLYFLPFSQDDYIKKPNSLVADYEKLPDAAIAAFEGRQLQPVLGF